MECKFGVKKDRLEEISCNKTGSGAKRRSLLPYAMKVSAMTAIAVFALAGCKNDNNAKPGGQVVAKVNNDEITIHQLNYILARTPPLPGINQEQAHKKVLDSLVEQQLLVQYAIKNKLDRDPNVVQSLEMSRTQILAQAAMGKIASVNGKVSKEEAREFYNKHPELFEKRRVYSFHQFMFDKSMLTDALRSSLDKAKSPGDVTGLLNGQKIAYQEQTISRPAEQWPIDILPSLAKLQKGDIAIQSDATRAMLMQLVNVLDEPVNEEKAAPAIEQYLNNNKKKEVYETAMADMKKSAVITYASDDGKKGVVENNNNAPPAAQAKKDEGYIEKGIAGLKK